MQLSVNKRGTSAAVKVYDAWDKAKKRSRVKCVGSIRLVPEVPPDIPEGIARQLTAKQRNELLQKLDALRLQRHEAARRRTPLAAIEAMGALAKAVAGGLVIDESNGDELRNALGTLAKAMGVDASARAETDPVAKTLNAVNELADRVHAGLVVDAQSGIELQMALGIVIGLLGYGATSASPTSWPRGSSTELVANLMPDGDTPPSAASA
jgi:hypothetical protein